MNFDVRYKTYIELFEKELKEYLNSQKNSVPKELYDAVVYATEGGGKRIRPVLCYAVADMLGLEKEEIKYFALAIEFIHSYSLIHDDLPCMDNDDFRRGKLSVHKKFGEAIAILTGDALLNLAAETCLKKPAFSEKDVSAMKILFYCAGMRGMIKGQVLDIKNEKKANGDETALAEIYINKTAKLIAAPILIASILRGKEYFDILSEYANSLGVMFQITDDILDEEGDFSLIGKTPKKDENADKLTAVKTYGIKGAKRHAEELYVKCKSLLAEMPDTEFLSKFTDAMYERTR